MTVATRRRTRGPERHERDAELLRAQREKDAEKRRRREERLLPQIQKTEDAVKAWEEARGKTTAWASFAFTAKPLVFRGEAEGALVLGVPSVPFGVEYMEKRYGKALGSVVRDVSDYRGVFLIREAEPEPGGDGCL